MGGCAISGNGPSANAISGATISGDTMAGDGACWRSWRSWGRAPARSLCGALLLAISWQPASAAAPTLIPGAWQIIATGTFGRATPPAGRRHAGGGSALKDELEVLAEYGVTDAVTLLFSPRVNAWAERGFHVAGFDAVTASQLARRLDLGASARLGARVRFWRDDRNVASVEASARAGALMADVSAPALQRAVEVEARLLWLRSFRLLEHDWFVDLQGGYRHRFIGGDAWRRQASTGEILFDATLGLHLTPRVMLLAQNLSVFAVSGAEGASSHKAQLSLAYRLSKSWTLQAGAMATYAGDRAWREKAVMLGVWRSFAP